MSSLIIPAQSDLALALREPNLLVPGRKPVGPIQVSDKARKHLDVLYSPRNSYLDRDLLSKYQLSAAPNGGTVMDGRVGLALNFDTKTGPYLPAPFSSVSRFLLIIQINPDAIDGNNVLFSFNTGYTDSFSLWVDNSGYYSGNTNIFAGQFLPSSGPRFESESNEAEAGKWQTVVCRYDGPNRTFNMFCNGREVAGQRYNVAASDYPTSITDIQNLYFANSTLNSYNGKISLMALGGQRALPSLVECKAISADPYNFLLKPANDAPYLFSIPGGAAGVTLTASTGSFTLTGNAAGLEAGRKLTAEAQSYALTGQAADLRRGFALLAEQGTITYTGNAAGLTAGRKLAADQQTYTLTGVDAGLTYTPAGSYDLTADTGAFTLTGIAADLLAGRTIAADSAAYTVTGIAANLTYTPTGSYSLLADTGSFVFTGVAADIVAARKLSADVQSYTLTGIAADFARGYGVSVDAGSFVLSGIDIAVQRTYQVAAGIGAYVVTGVDVDLDYSGQEVWTQIASASTTWTNISSTTTTWTEID